jgi:hypothetical protein
MTLTLEQFRATRRVTTMAEQTLGADDYDPSHETRTAWVYEQDLVIDTLQDGTTPWLLIENQEYVGPLEILEQHLYDYYLTRAGEQMI